MTKKIIVILVSLMCFFLNSYSQAPVVGNIVEARDHMFFPVDTIKAPKRLGEIRIVYVEGYPRKYKCIALNGSHKWELEPDLQYLTTLTLVDSTIIYTDMPGAYAFINPTKDTIDLAIFQLMKDSAGWIQTLTFGNLDPLFTITYDDETDHKNPTITFNLSNAAQNTVLAGPTSGTGAPTYRALVAGDIPNIDASKITTGTIVPARLGSGTANNTTVLYGDGVYRTPTGGISSLTGDVTASGTGAVAATIANDAVSNAKQANMATKTIKGRNTAGTGDPEDLSTSTVKSMLSMGIGAEWEIVEDFYVGYLSNNFLLFNGNGGSAGAIDISDVSQRGISRLTSGTSSASAYSLLTTHDNSFGFGSTTYSIDVKDITIGTLNSASDSSAYMVGWFDALFTNGNPADGAYVAYVQTEANWRCVTISNGTQTVTSSTVAVGTGFANSIDVEIRANSTSVEFYINGVIQATHTTNIPSGITRTFAMGYGIKKKLGTGQRTFDVDRILFKTL